MVLAVTHSVIFGIVYNQMCGVGGDHAGCDGVISISCTLKRIPDVQNEGLDFVFIITGTCGKTTLLGGFVCVKIFIHQYWSDDSNTNQDDVREPFGRVGPSSNLMSPRVDEYICP